MASIKNKWITWNENDKIANVFIFACGVCKDRYIFMSGRNQNLAAKEDVIFDTKTKTKITLPMLANRKLYPGIIFNGNYYVNYPGYMICYFSFSDTKDDDDVSNRKHVCPLRMANNMIKSCNLRIYCQDPMTRQFKFTHAIQDEHTPGAAVAVGNKIFFIGKAENRTWNVDVFDASTNSSNRVANLPRTFITVLVTVYRRWIIIAGTMTGFSWNECFVFDTQTQQWIECKWYPAGYIHHLVTVGSQIVSITFDGYMKAIHVKHIIPDCHWEIIKDFVLLRKLIDDNRACFISTSENLDQNNAGNTVDPTKVAEKLFTDLNLDIFRNVMTYLI